VLVSEWLPLVLLPLLAGALRLGGRPGPRASWHDGAVAIGLSVGVAVAAATWFARFYVSGSVFIQSDFSQYCEVVDAARSGKHAVDGPHRSWLVGRALGPLADALGTRDALAAGAVISTAVVGIGLYVWGLAVAGRTAAVASAAGLLAIAPLVLLSRTVTFYPELCATLATMAGATAMAVRTRHVGWVAAAGVLVALAPLVDLKAVPWMLPMLAVVTGAAMWAPAGPLRWARALGRVALVAGLLAASWRAGAVVWPADMGSTLEVQMASYVTDVERRAGTQTGLAQRVGHPDLCGYHPSEGLRWGTGDPRNVPRTIQCLRTMRALIPESALQIREIGWARSHQVSPLLFLSAGAGVVALLGLGIHAVRRRTLARLAALVLTFPPFLYTLAAAAREDADLRRLAPSLLFAPVLFGVAWAVLVRWRSAAAPSLTAQTSRERGWNFAAASLGALALALLLTGAVPSGLSPAASWHAVTYVDEEWRDILAGKQTRPPEVACGKAHARDLARGQPSRSRFADVYGEAPF
jgi:hypothetical protein